MSAPLLIGTLLALGALAVVLTPLFFPPDDDGRAIRGPAAPAAPAGRDAVEAALAAFRAARPDCADCGPRPEADAVYCSSCGRPLARRDAVQG